MRIRKCQICGIETARRYGEKPIIMAQFPLNPKRCKKWVKAVGKEDLAYIPIEKLHQLKCVCVAHFAPEDFRGKTTQLKPTAVPSIGLTAEPLSDEVLSEFVKEKPIEILQIDNTSTPSITKPKAEMTEVLGSSSEMDSVEKEAKSKAGSKSYMCPECGYTCRSAERVATHIEKKHRTENKYKCTMCNYCTYSKSLFEEHVNRHKGVKPYKCSVCRYTSVSKKYVKMHEEKHVRCECGFIGRSCNSHAYKRHVRICGIFTRVGQCQLCQLEFADEAQFKKHKLSRYPCEICSVETCSGTHRKHMMKAHNTTIHTKNLKEAFRCSVCGWTSISAQKVLLHLIHHPQEAPGFEMPVVLKKCGILT